MGRKVQFFLMGLLALLLAAGVMAQDATDEAPAGDAEQTCTPEQWEGFVPHMNEIVETITGDDPLLALFQIEAVIESIRATCTGGVWTSEDYGENSVVIGPVIFSGTLYEATLKTTGSASASMTTLEGKCDELESIILTTDLDSEEEEEATVLYEFENCIALFEVEGYGDSPWSFNVVKLR